jgi:colanic acid/amylovoran biosynthesis glycosyltransferase
MIFVGRFVEKKGIPDMLRAIALVTKRHKNILLHVVGGGGTSEFHAEIERLTTELGISTAVKFYGMKPHAEMLEMLKDVDLMVQLSKTAPDGDTDDLPFVLLEAGESGLPAITTRHVGIPDAIKDGETGLLVPEGDYRAAAEKIVYLIEHPECVSAMSLAVHKFVDTTFGLARLNKRLFDLYSSLT